MTYYEEDNPEVFPRFPDELPPEFPAPSGGLLRDPDVVALEKRIESTLEQTDPGENHKELMEMLGGIFVQLSRIYDVLMLDSPNQKVLDDDHSEGKLFASPPILLEDAWSEDVQEESEK